MQKPDAEINQPLDEVAEAIRLARLQLRLSQSEVAEKAGVGLRQVSALELRKGPMRLDTLRRIAGAVGLELKVTVEAA